MKDFPPELVDRVSSFLCFSDRCVLSSVNSQFRNFLSPSIFQCLKITCSEKLSDVEDLVVKHGRCVKALHFDLDLLPNEVKDGSDAESEQTHNVLSPATLGLLRGESLPNLNTLRIHFRPLNDFDGDGFDNNEFMGTIYVHTYVEGEEDIVKAEREFSWRALMKSTMETLTSNDTIRHLEFRNLPPLGTSCYRSEPWQQWFGRLESFDISLWAGDNGAGWQSNTCDGYWGFVADMEGYFFDHLSSAKRLHFAADDNNLVGCEGHNHGPIPLGLKSAPQIQQLELHNCIIDSALSIFLVQRSECLRSLRLINSYAGGSSTVGHSADNPISWAQLFTAIEGSKPCLSDLVVTNDYSKWDDDLYDVDDGVEASLRRFPHATADGKYGSLYPIEEYDAASFKHGEDERSFNSLMKLVVENQGRERA